MDDNNNAEKSKPKVRKCRFLVGKIASGFQSFTHHFTFAGRSKQEVGRYVPSITHIVLQNICILDGFYGHSPLCSKIGKVSN